MHTKIDYPIEYFPPEVQKPVLEIQKSTQAPLEMVGDTLLSALALACQGTVMFKYQDGRMSPVSLYVNIIAPSGERKTGVYYKVFQPFLDFEKFAKKEYSSQLKDYQAEYASWKAVHKVLLKRVSKNAEMNLDLNSVNEALKQHQTQKPEPPRLPKIIYTDATPGAILKGLSENLPTAGLTLDEGGVFYRGYGSNNLPVYNQAWDGVSIEVERKDHTLIIDDCRFTILLMIQPEEFKHYLKRHGEHAFGSGFFPRCLITGVTSTQGKRDNRAALNVNTAVIERFYQRITSLLELMLKNESPRILSLSAEAQQRLTEFQNTLEPRMVHDSGLHSALPSILSKVPENAVRIAALFHQFCGYEEDEISLTLIQSAIKVMSYHYQQATELLLTGLASPDNDAEVLYNWFLTGRLHNSTVAARSLIRRYAPSQLRDRYRLDKALGILEEDGRARVVLHRNPNGSITKMVNIYRQ